MSPRPRLAALTAGGLAPDVAAYAGAGLIAYIGNKRAILPFLNAAFDAVEARHPVRRFVDPFAGSGAVSRLARARGWEVAASDCEDYAAAVNACWLGVPAQALPALFCAEGGVETVFRLLNRMHPARENETRACAPYIARHYAPACTATADPRRERLFYTAENAVFIDRVRSAIEAMRPAAFTGSAEEGRRHAMERALLLGPLIYEAATHANTSGVFKACHRGFGGHGKDALGRILAPMELEVPRLWPGDASEVALSDAAAFCSGRSADLCYLDPPYNQHQYGSNYHLLNTIVRWEGKPVSEAREPDGSLRDKAGIDPDWKRTKSAFCSRRLAASAFRELFDAIDARFILLSYNDAGIVPLEELYELLARDAVVELRQVGHVSYRGGRQSATRRLASREFLFVAERKSGRPDPRAALSLRDAAISALRAEARLGTLLAAPLALERVRALSERPSGRRSLRREGESLVYAWPGGELRIVTYHLLEIESREALSSLPRAERGELATLLAPLAAQDQEEALFGAALLIEEGNAELRLQRFALGRLRKLAHPRYRGAFEALWTRFCCSARARPGELWRLAEGLAELRALAEARMGALCLPASDGDSPGSASFVRTIGCER